MKIAMIGAGGMGCRFALALRESGADVVLCDVWREHVDRIRADGLEVKEAGGMRRVEFAATTEIETVGPVDLAVIFTKSYHTKDAVARAMPVIGAITPFVTFQNGLGNIDVLTEYAGADRVIVGITDYPTSLPHAGAVNIEGKGYTRLSALTDAQTDMAMEICRLLAESGMNCAISADIMKEVWEKLAFNCAHNPITALTRQRVGNMGRTPYGDELCGLVAREVCAVAAADGVSASLDAVLAKFARTIDPSESGDHVTSMLQDVLKGRATEIDSICGAVLSRAERYDVETPHLRVLYDLMKIVELNYANEVKACD